MTAALVAALALAIWVYLIVGRGFFWLCAERGGGPSPAPPPGPWPDVVAIVPARNEADMINRSVGSLLRQDYPGRLRIVVVDDQSTDGTAQIARDAAAGDDARLTIVAGREPPPGWTGKLWAMRQGLAHLEKEPDAATFMLFSDADIAYAPHVLRSLVAEATARRLVLSSLMAKLRCESRAERLLVPAFIFFFQKLYPFAWVNDPSHAAAAAAGGCMLVDRAVLARAGGLDAIRGALIDDCALGRLMKRHGPIRLALAEGVASLRPYPAFGDIRRMVVRSAYAELRYSPWRLAGAVAGMALTYLAPPLLVVFSRGLPQAAGAAALALMVVAFAPTLRFYGLSRLWGLALPAIAAIYMAFTLDSAVEHWRGRGGLWKGRFQAAPKRSTSG